MDWAWAVEQGAAARGEGFWQLGAVVAAIVALGAFARWRKARLPPRKKAAELRAIFEESEKYRSAADQAMVDLIETGREISAQIDTKIRILNRLVKDADERIAKLESFSRTGAGAGSGGATIPVFREEAGKGGGAASQGADDEASTEVFRPEGGRGKGMAWRSRLQARIMDLHGAGRSFSEIARATGLSIRDVELAVGHGRQPE